jgi:hypothetical protein
MTDLPAHPILYDLQYARGGEGDERTFVNVTDIADSHADGLLAQIRRDQIEREQMRANQQQQHVPPAIPILDNVNHMPTGTYRLGFDRQHEQIAQQQQVPPAIPILDNANHMPTGMYRLGFDRQEQPSNPFDVDQQLPSSYQQNAELQQNDYIRKFRQQRQQEERQAEQIAFGFRNPDHSNHKVSNGMHTIIDEFDDKVRIVFE